MVLPITFFFPYTVSPFFDVPFSTTRFLFRFSQNRAGFSQQFLTKGHTKDGPPLKGDRLTNQIIFLIAIKG